MYKLAAGLLTVWVCSAQTHVPTPDEIVGAMGRNNLPSPFERFNASRDAERLARPSGESVSVAGLQHRVPKTARQSLSRAEKLAHAGDHRGAAAELESAIRADPKFDQGYHWLGVEYAQMGRLADAAATFRKLLELEPDNWRVHYNLGLALLQANDLSGADRSARRALQLAPTEPNVNLLVGCVLSVNPKMRSDAESYVRYAARTLPQARPFLKELESGGN